MPGLTTGSFLEDFTLVFSILLFEFATDFVTLHDPLILDLVQGKFVSDDDCNRFSALLVFQNCSS
jgi:hypothetical protein